jgi:hypothetical protein
MPFYIRKKRNLVLMIFGLISTTFMIQTVSAKSSKPNFVFFLVDDFGWASISSMGDEFLETPNIDKLAKSGMQFTNGYAACFMHDKNRSMPNFQNRIQTIIISKECNDEQN